ncbi:MAG: DNA methyltransferase, partial [Ilumatobacteraceae bacterium]
LAKSGGTRALIICPLGVRGEFHNDANKLGLHLTFVRHTDQVGPPGLYITNYESVRDGRLDPTIFDAVSLDEASVLRSYGSKTYQSFLAMFDTVRFKFVATATPSPNRFKELIHYAGFLGVMDTGQALTRWFKRDSTSAGNLQLHPHKEQEFWLWLSTWAAFVQKPSDLGFSDDGYEQPAMDVHRHEVVVDHTQGNPVERDGTQQMFRGGDLSMVEASREKRRTLPLRLEQAMQIIGHYRDAGDLDQIVLWCDLNDEQAAIERALAGEGITFSSVHGSLDPDEAERRLNEWRNKETVALIGKPVMLGQGVNLQQCNKAIFVGITFKFNDLIQACHRLQRFGQRRVVQTHIIHADSERHVYTTLMKKWAQHEELTATMTDLIQEHGLNVIDMTEILRRANGVERCEASGEGWEFVLNDAVRETETMDEASVDMILSSIPFGTQYEYSANMADFGHTDDNSHFWQQMDHLTPRLLKVLQPGRIFACHVKDRIKFGNQFGTGLPTVEPFHAEAIAHYRGHGFDYLGMITVVTDVVRENNTTYRLGYSEMCKDGSKMGVGMPEYILIFHKPQSDREKGYADTRIVKDKAKYSLARWQQDAHAFWRSSGDRPLTPDELLGLTPQQIVRLFTQHSLATTYDFEAHVKLGDSLAVKGALPSTFMLLAPGSHNPDVWHDVNRMDTGNTAQALNGKEAHICPLQHDIVDRLIDRYSQAGELIFDPFGGLGTTVYRALKAGRRGKATELNPVYWTDGVRYCQIAERQASMPTLFDIDDEPAA